MADPQQSAISAIVEPLTLVFSTIFGVVRAVPWTAIVSSLATVLALPWKIVLIPLTFFVHVLLAVFAPLIHILAFGWGVVQGIFSFLASLEPLYTFFAVAAIVGTAAGLTLSLFSQMLAIHLKLRDCDQETEPLALPSRTRRHKKGFLKAEAEDSSATSSNDGEWGWAETTTSTSPTRWRPVSGLLSQTIHEEDDSDGIS